MLHSSEHGTSFVTICNVYKGNENGKKTQPLSIKKKKRQFILEIQFKNINL